eukprot:gnl/TRDRNA2_/TRDRNA2_199090_c0_seq1.p1 gnl/TRDRNA2_/TRDRNA2_199090_c0~~gnl/TRDRNA2_/TRDRNA2_199090_c0_seq1.p1  ORF type:complete len:164 (+),score=24.24 gnl/TRDRNA2_/TRDRNA2_199090_c0_seq1:67-558(+)
MNTITCATLFVLVVGAAYYRVAASEESGEAFLARKAKEEGVMPLGPEAPGMLYKVLRKGTGNAHPRVSTPCLCHYQGTLINGKKFDSSYDRGQPTTFAPSQVIKGWTVAMQKMVEGDKWEMYIPSKLAYGAEGHPPVIPRNAVLVFTMEIVKINGPSVPKTMR